MRQLDADISRADLALDAGSSVEATAIAQEVLARAVASKDVRAEAKALSCLANCDRLLSRFRRSHYASRRAADLFAQVQDVAGEASALGVHAHAGSVLGRNDEAVEAGLLSVQLSESIGEPRPLAVAKIQLGVAYFFSRSFDRAHSTLDDAIYLSKTCVPRLSPFQARVTQGCAEVVRGMTERSLGKTPGSDERLRHILAVGSELFQSGDGDAIGSGVRVSKGALWFLVSATAHVWSGAFELADAELETAVQWMSGFGVTTSLSAFAELVRAERAQALGDWKGAEEHGNRAVDLATKAEHEQFAQLGILLTAHALQEQGKLAEALGLQRELMIREQTIRVASLNDRASRLSSASERAGLRGLVTQLLRGLPAPA